MALWQSRASPTLTPYLKLTSERASKPTSERASRRDNMKFTDFTDDEEKMRDFFALDKKRFLEMYSYLTEEEYNLTKNKLNQQASEQKG